MQKSMYQEIDNDLLQDDVIEDDLIEDESQRKITFSEFVKEDLYTNEKYSENDYKTILYSYIRNNLVVKIQNSQMFWVLKTQNPQIIDFILIAFSKFKKIDIKYEILVEEDRLNKDKMNYYLHILEGYDNIEKILKLFDDELEENFKKEKFASNFLIGTMLSGGSISNPVENNHLELRCDSHNYFNMTKLALERIGIEFKTLKRHSKDFIYIKKGEIISDFLKAIGAKNAFFSFEEIKIAKDHSNQIQRLNNLDVSNIAKTSKANVVILEMIKQIKKHQDFKKQSDKFIKYCELKEKNPDTSINEISKIMESQYNIKISKGGINHFNLKIKKLFSELK